MSQHLKKYAYAANYCEENIWQLTTHPDIASILDECFVLFISNLRRQCPIWNQRASLIHGDPVLWDYHVILIHKTSTMSTVWDLDSLMGAPIPFEDWWLSSFPLLHAIPQEYHPLFRKITANMYRDTFSSDRRHMRDQHNAWLMPPPPWPEICRGPSPHNLPELIDMSIPSPGQILDAEDTFLFFASTP